MRVLIVNTSERIGGAAIAANRLTEALKKSGVKATMMVRDRQSSQVTVRAVGSGWIGSARFLWERICIWAANGFSRHNLFQVDLANTGTDITRTQEFQRADVVHLHWVNQGFLSLKGLERIMRSGKKVVITMHDQWYFTGICHLIGSCTKYQTMCHDCPLMTRRWWSMDLARRVFLHKQRVYGRADITFVGCSQWIANCARKAALLQGQRVVSIPNPIDTELFAPADKTEARQRFGLPTDRRLLLFGCRRITDENKGFHLMAESLKKVEDLHPDLAGTISLVVVGGEAESVRGRLSMPTIAIPYVSDPAAMVALYNAVDAYVTPSLQENLPNTIMEAMACGTPCVGFCVGGIPEMIDHKHNGYVADYKSAQDLADGIAWTLTTDHEALSRHARQKVMDEYSESVVARRYIDVYED